MKLRDAFQLLTHTYQPAGLNFNEHEIALTFDDGPDPIYTPLVLSILARFKVKATFFIVGKQVEKYPDLVQKIHQEGHAIGNHTWSHELPFCQSKNRIEQEIEKTQFIIKHTCGITPTLFRPPFGVSSRAMEAALDFKGLDLILWTQSLKDWNAHKPEKIEKAFRKGLKGGAIYLVHDGLMHSKKQSRHANIMTLESNIAYAFSQGFTFRLID